jgi:hypothetical protein
MKSELIVVAALAAGLSACGGADVRYAPMEAVVPLPRERMMRIAAITIKDVSGGVRAEGASLSMKRPFFDVFREAAQSRLDALKVKLSKRGGTFVDVELNRVDIKGGVGGAPDVTATVAYSVVVRGGLDAVCRQDASAWATSRPGLAESPAADALQKALVKAVDRLGPAIADSCLYSSLPVPPKAAPRDPNALAIIIGVERYREGVPSASFAESDARAVAVAVKSVLGAEDDRIVLLLGERATLADFNKYFESWLPAHAGPDAKVLVYFAGNGAPAGKTGAGSLVPYDGDPNFLAETSFPLERLYAALGRLPGETTVALDACFSGEGARSVLPAGEPPLRRERAARLPAGVTVISAASPGQTCGLDEDAGLFTRYFLQGLKERDGNMKAAFDFLEPEVKKAAQAALKPPQSPRWSRGL